MKRQIDIFVGREHPHPIAMLHFNAQGSRQSAAFAYDATWLADPDRFAIDPLLPLVPGPQFHRKHSDGSLFHGALADTEPDGWARQVIRRDHAKRRAEARRPDRDVDAPLLNALDYLLAVDDFSRVGALRFRDEGGIFQRAPEKGRRTAPPLIELGMLLAATRAVETHSETAADLAYLRGRGTSLGGARPKCTVIDDDGQLSIGKFPSVADERAITKGEVLAMRLATAAGINAAPARIVDSDGTPVALIRRFDRTGDGRRLMYISAATMLGVERRDRNDHTYTEIVDALRTHGAATGEDIEELWRRLAFNILITNIDDHLLNHGFLHVERGKWRLAPAFDINPFPERVRELKTWISEDSGPEGTVDALMAATPYFRIALLRAKEILAEVESAVARWRVEGRAIGLSDTELDQFADAFEHTQRTSARHHATSTSP